MDKDTDVRSLNSQEKLPNHPLQHFSSEPLLKHMRRLSQSVFPPKPASPAELPKLTFALEDYEIRTCIGQGSSGSVYIAKHLETETEVAIKVLELDMFERNQIDELRKEIQIMALSKHPNLLQVYGSFVSGSKLYIVTPILLCGSALDIIRTAHPDGLEETVIATILKQALQGLEYLHKTGLIHRDVKAGNLLVDKDGLVQLADFGVSSSLMESGERKGMRKTFVGTPSWMSPEVMEQSGYDYKADIWSFGITAIELATGRAPYAKYSPIKILMLTLQNDPPTLDRNNCKHKFSKTFKDMIDNCLKKDPTKRPTAEKLLTHAFFKQAKKPSYLCASILDSLNPLELRHRKLKEKSSRGFEDRIVSWDFPDDFQNPESLSSTENENSLVSKLEKVERKGASIRFVLPDEDGEKDEMNSLKSPTCSESNLSFGDRSSSSVNLKQKGRFSLVDGNSGIETSKFDAKDDNTPVLSPKSTLERKMGRFAIQSSPRLPEGKPNDSHPDLSRNASTESTLKTNSRFTRASDSSIPLTQSESSNGNNDSVRGRFQISPAEFVDKNAIPGVDPELLLLAMQDPVAGISHLSLEERYSYLLNHCAKQSGLVEQLVSIIRRNSGSS